MKEWEKNIGIEEEDTTITTKNSAAERSGAPGKQGLLLWRRTLNS
jgi:hypothetical protein